MSRLAGVRLLASGYALPSFCSDTQNDGSSAMINRTVLHAYTPVDVIIGKGAVRGSISHVVVAQAAAARGLAAAVVVGNDVVQVVRRVLAGADPGHGVHTGSRGTGNVGAAAATAEETVNGAVAPVIAGGGVARVCIRVAAGLRRHTGVAATATSVRGPGHRQQRHRSAGRSVPIPCVSRGASLTCC